MSNKILLGAIGLALFLGILATLLLKSSPAPVTPLSVATTTPSTTLCTADAMLCPDGSYVGRTGEKCEFVCPPVPEVPADVKAQIDAKADKIKITNPLPMSVVQSPLEITGQARGTWFFEASAPVSLVDWDGKIIAQGTIKAEGDWMTTEFVPFTAELTFTSPYKEGDQDTFKRGALIFKKDNPSGLPENDDSLEIPISFSK
jgi:Immunoglobulin-like domain of bacterial spore germination